MTATATHDRIDLALDKALAERSLHEFFRQSWHVTTPGATLCDGWYLEAIAEHLEAVIAGLIRDLLILVSPRCGKSLLTSVCLPAWTWIRRPEERFLCASYGQKLSNDFSTESRRLMLSPWYQQRWGTRWQFVGDVNRITEMQNNRNGHRIATSVDGEAAGRGGDTLLCDDPHKLRDVASDLKRGAVHEWWRKDWSTRRNGPTSARITIMQRSHADDLARRIIDDGAAVLEIPMEWHEHVKPWPLERLKA